MSFTRKELLETSLLQVSKMKLSASGRKNALEFLSLANNTELKMFLLGSKVSKAIITEGYNRQSIDIIFENVVDEYPIYLSEFNFKDLSNEEWLNKKDKQMLDATKRNLRNIAVTSTIAYTGGLALALLKNKFGKCLKHCDPGAVKKALKFDFGSYHNTSYRQACIIECKIQYYKTKKDQKKIEKWTKKKEQLINHVNSEMKKLNTYGDNGKLKAKNLLASMKHGFEVKAY